MRLVLFYHSLVSDWNHGNAHFLRGVVRELLGLGHEVVVYEPREGWSLSRLRQDHGEEGVREFARAFPGMRSAFYDQKDTDLDAMIGGADGVIVHEWNPPALVAAIGAHRRRARPGYALLFHDTHHRSVSAPEEMARYDLRGYDGVLAFGAMVRDIYLERGWASAAWAWHEAADVAHYRPLGVEPERDLVWIGNWGDGERSEELEEFLLGPARRLGLAATVRGVRYPDEAVARLGACGVEYGGWASARAAVGEYARHRVTVHVPRRWYARALRGIPTIRVFEALACGMPLVCAPWEDSEGLFTPGDDYLVARDGAEMEAHLGRLLADPAAARGLGRRGRETVLARHTCAHRAEELMGILAGLGVGGASQGVKAVGGVA